MPAGAEAFQRGLYRERVFPRLWSGDGLLVCKTKVAGQGDGAVFAPGPVDVVSLDDEELHMQVRLVLGRTAGLRLSSRRASGFFPSFLVGQQRLRVCSGTGKVLVCWTPDWNHHMYRRMTGEDSEGRLFE
jgi:uncharacterized protein (AIM24 family)